MYLIMFDDWGSSCINLLKLLKFPYVRYMMTDILTVLCVRILSI